MKSSVVRQEFYSSKQSGRQGVNVASAKPLKLCCIARTLPTAHPVCSSAPRNILVVRERTALGVFCIIYVSAVHAHERVHPAAARQPHVAYTDHVNTSRSAHIVVFYGELDFSPSVGATRALLRCGKNCLPRSSATCCRDPFICHFAVASLHHGNFRRYVPTRGLDDDP